MEVPFVGEMLGLTMIELLNHKVSCTITVKVRYVRNTEFLDVINNSSEPIIFNKDEAQYLVDLRPI